MKRSSSVFLFIVLSAATIFGQLQLSYLNSRDVKQGASLQTSVDSFMLDMDVNSGIAVSRYTMVVTPGSYTYLSTAESVTAFDSIEITASFQLPSDFVADSMWLWINGKPVPAAIQDRALAAAQYQQIVGVRKDPAILETWGRGSYSLRIFPASSFKSRKITIEFHHTFNDDSLAGSSPLITACIPAVYDSAYVYRYSGVTSSFPDKAIGTVVANFSAGDQGTYGVDLPGVGSGSFSASKSLTLSARRVFKLQPGTVTSTDPSAADKFLWVGRDPKVGGLSAGIAAELSDANMRFEAEPDVRIIAIDMRNKMWDWNEYYNLQQASYNRTYTPYSGYEKYNIWERAQKYAVLALRQYLKEGQKFNILIGGKTVQSVFEAPVAVTAENLVLAVNAIVAASPSQNASTEEILKSAINQAPGGIIVLISDLIQPPDYTTYVDNKYSVSKTGLAYDTAMSQLRKLVGASSATLFTIDDNYQLVQLALQTGGYRLSGILNRYNVAYHYEVIEGKRITIPELPDLFGSSNSSGIRNISVTSDALTDIAHTLDGYYSNYYYYSTRGGVMMETDAVMTKSLAKMVLPTTYNPAAALIRIAGKLPNDKNGKPVTVTVRGKTGGLWFTNVLNAIGGLSEGGKLPATPQWAFRKSEQLGYDDYVANAAAIKTIGKEYHIVTRQTSLLALEPGMNLWEDTAWQQSSSSAEKTSNAIGGVAATTADASYRAATTEGGAPTSAVGSGVSFDGISLADIVARKDISAVVGKQSAPRSFSVVPAGSAIRVSFTGGQLTGVISLHLFDLKGRLVAQRTFTPDGIGGTSLVWNFAGGSSKLCTGMYTVRVSSGDITKNFRITLLGN